MSEIVKKKQSKARDRPCFDIKADTEKGYTRRFAISTYIPFQDVLNWLKISTKWIQHYALCCHDKDLDDDGAIVTPHTHIVLQTYSAKTCSAICKHFDNLAEKVDKFNPQNTFVEKCTNIVSAFRYLRHLDNSKKYQYSVNELFMDSIDYWGEMIVTDGLIDGTKNTAYSILMDMENGVDKRTMCQRYGKEFIYHYKQYDEMKTAIDVQEFRNKYHKKGDVGMVRWFRDNAYKLPFDDEKMDLFFVILSFYDNLAMQQKTTFIINDILIDK